MNLNEYDCIYSPCVPINITNANVNTNIKFLFGPHFSVFPDDKVNLIKNVNSVYVQPSKWASDVWIKNPLCNNLLIKALPFGVNTNKFVEKYSIKERNNVFIYYKSRDPKELYALKQFLDTMNIKYKIFSYHDRYHESDYLEFLQTSKYGIWLGGHESQGFALQEALSCNVPLLVWNVKSMNQEYKSTYDDIPATSIPYWSDQCGEYFYDINELDQCFKKFQSNLESYKPREYILENVSEEVCEKKLIDIILYKKNE